MKLELWGFVWCLWSPLSPVSKFHTGRRDTEPVIKSLFLSSIPILPYHLCYARETRFHFASCCLWGCAHRGARSKPWDRRRGGASSFLLASSAYGCGAAMFPHSNIGTSFLWQLLNPVYGCFCNQPHCTPSEATVPTCYLLRSRS